MQIQVSALFAVVLAAAAVTVSAQRSAGGGGGGLLPSPRGTVSGQDARLFGVNTGSGGDFLVTLDPSNANLTVVGNTGITCDGISFAPDGTLYAADNTNGGRGQLVTLNPATGAVDTVIGPFVNVTTVEGLAAHPTSGVLYGIDIFGWNLVTIDTKSGLATLVGSFNCCNSSMAGLSWSADGSVLYGIDFFAGCLWIVNPLTGNATLIGCGDANEPLGLATDPTTGQLYSADWAGGFVDGVLSRVNAADGSRVDVGPMVGGPQIEGLSFELGPLGTNYCVTNANSTGSAAEISASGTASSTAANLTLTSAPVPNQNGIFFHGANQANLPFGNGTLCTTGGIRRGAVVLASGNSASTTYDNSGPKFDLSDFVGTARNFQHWFRDPMGGGALFNTSNAISILILP